MFKNKVGNFKKTKNPVKYNHGALVCDGMCMVFLEIITYVLIALVPLDNKLLLCHPITQPAVILYVPTSGMFDSHFGVNETITSEIIGNDRYFSLRMTNSDESITNDNCCATIMEDSATLGFSSR